mgnify:CR=1 FL=1
MLAHDYNDRLGVYCCELLASCLIQSRPVQFVHLLPSMLQEASAAERIVLIVLLAATLASSVVALMTIFKRWYAGVGRAVIVGVPARAVSPSAAAAPDAQEKQHLLVADSADDVQAAYISLPSPTEDTVGAGHELP